MKKHIQNLIIAFLKASQEQFDKYHTVDKYKYFEIIRCLSSLKSELISEEKHKFLFRYINQPHRSVERFLFEKEISHENLNEPNFYRMHNYLIGVNDWIKK